MKRLATLLCALLLTACASLSDRARDSLEQPGLEGTRWGLVVMTMDGRELVSLNADERFLPASNTKLFTTAAAFHRLGDMTQPDLTMGTALKVELREDGPPDVVLVGAGDATLLDATPCPNRNCLSELADLLANASDAVNDVIADETWYPHEPAPPGWSHEDLLSRSGAPVSALTVNSNQVVLIVTPGANPGDTAAVAWRDEPALYELVAVVVSVDGEMSAREELTVSRRPGSSVVSVRGTVQAGTEAITIPIAVDDPAMIAATRLRLLFEARGIRTSGKVAVRDDDAPMEADTTSPRLEGDVIELARLTPPPLIENVTFLMKQSQNLHAELLLRRLGLIEGDGSREAGLKVVEAMLNEAGVPRWSWDFSDGSGMSVYNRVTPQTTADFLLWTTKQPWGEAFRDTLPIGGVDGTIRRRFAGTSLEGRVFAKTGTLRGTNALSGFMMTKSGQMLVFSAFANERPTEAESAIAALDATLVAISETN
jgi:D-alanyl-D-alanine carboxypeptidase/D-alanyl-D-alanine-endopeptidase (penicillin-binding protein 4)